MIIQANCKINLGLDIIRRREDGYHELETLMFPVRGLYDIVEVNKTQMKGAQFISEGIVIDCPEEDNICLKAYRLMHEKYGIEGVEIRLRKQVPFGAGLGGGSSDATAVVMAIDQLFDLHLSEEELIERAAELGSDTAFFVRNTPQLCTGRGELMTPMSLPLDGMVLALIKPDDKVSTKEAYSGVTPRKPEISLKERLQSPLAQWQGIITNDFEEHIFMNHPSIANAKQLLKDEGAIYASMSGSGSAVFGIFSSDVDQERLKRLTPYVYTI